MPVITITMEKVQPKRRRLHDSLDTWRCNKREKKDKEESASWYQGAIAHVYVLSVSTRSVPS